MLYDFLMINNILLCTCFRELSYGFHSDNKILLQIDIKLLPGRLGPNLKQQGQHQ